MRPRYTHLVGWLIAGLASLAAAAPAEPSHTRLGAEKPFREFIQIQVRNFQDEKIGRITDLAVDLVNGRIVEVLIVSDRSLKIGGRIIAVPPLALSADYLNEVYRLNVSTAAFMAAPAIDLSRWEDHGRSDRVAAAYRHFGQEPYFLLDGESVPLNTARPKVPLGMVERCSKLVDLPVGNLQGQKFGKIWALNFDIPRGRIANVVIIAPGNFLTKSIVPATALRFNPGRTGLLLDQTKEEFRDEPRYVFTEAAFGQDSYYERESYEGPRTSVALAQGNRYRDVDATLRINQEIRATKIDAQNVEVGTLNGRVTLRGWVLTAEDKRRIGDIAIAASRLEVVDNQILVGQPITGR